MRNRSLWIGNLLLFLAVPLCAFILADDAGNKPPLKIPKCPENSIRIDGLLKEKAWQTAAKIQLLFEIYPSKNTSAIQKTECYLTYDTQHLYVAFIAWDQSPESIRAHLSDRDSITEDDQVGFYLDTFNDEHKGYSFFVNPLGVQADSFRDDLSKGEDKSWDAIWDSHGIITETGYQVEFAIPFSQLRTQQGNATQVWGFSGQRNIPRDSLTRNATQKMDLYNQEYFKQFSKIQGFENISASRHIQLTPTLTAFNTRHRPDFPIGDFRELSSDARMGITGSWGISPNVTLSGTINPDFSQIEADAAQLDVNLSYALIFPEKRPFFLEGINQFQTHQSIVSTRTIADPRWGLKILGQEGNSSFALLAAQDRQTNLTLPGNQGSRILSLPIDSYSTAVRYQREIGDNSGLGFIVTDRRGDDYSNSVYALDGTFNLTSADSIKIQALQSQTKYPEYYSLAWNQPLNSFDGGSIKFNYNHFTRNLQYYLYYEGIGNTFRAEMGYVPQVNRNYINSGIGYTHWFERNSLLVYLQAFAAYQHSQVSDGKVLYNAFKSWASLQGPQQSNLYYAYHKYLHHYQGIDHNILTHDLRFRISLNGDLFFNITLDQGDRIDYLQNRLGERIKISPSATLNFGRNLRLSFRHDYERFTIQKNRLYLANLSQLTAVYSFSPKSFLRIITQYNDVRKNQSLYSSPISEISRKLFNQILYTYKVNPQTVIYLGYSDNFYNGLGHHLIQKDKTWFFKLSYAWLN